jgi:hypothetical protein
VGKADGLLYRPCRSSRVNRSARLGPRGRTPNTAVDCSWLGGHFFVRRRMGDVDGDIKPYWASLRCLPLCCWKTLREQRLYSFPLLIQQHVNSWNLNAYAQPGGNHHEGPSKNAYQAIRSGLPLRHVAVYGYAASIDPIRTSQLDGPATSNSTRELVSPDAGYCWWSCWTLLYVTHSELVMDQSPGPPNGPGVAPVAGAPWRTLAQWRPGV